MQLGRPKYLIAQCSQQRHEEMVFRAHPIAHRAVAELDPIASVYHALPMQRNRVRVFADKDMREQSRPAAARDRTAWRRRLHHAVQQVQANFGHTCCTTLKLAGTYSSTLLMSSSSRFHAPPAIRGKQAPADGVR